MSYEILDFVSHNGSSYLALTDVPPDTTPKDDMVYWMQACSGGGSIPLKAYNIFTGELVMDENGSIENNSSTNSTLISPLAAPNYGIPEWMTGFEFNESPIFIKGIGGPAIMVSYCINFKPLGGLVAGEYIINTMMPVPIFGSTHVDIRHTNNLEQKIYANMSMSDIFINLVDDIADEGVGDITIYGTYIGVDNGMSR
jgi:hypothetical protein